MRASRDAAAASAIATAGLLVAAGGQVWAQGDCQAAFERWARLSSAQVRAVPQSESQRGACIPTEAARSDLLERLDQARALCGDSSSTDPMLQQTRTMLSINQSFISALTLCNAGGAGTADTGAGWITKAAPAPKVPPPPPMPPPRPAVVAAPIPPPPPAPAPPPKPAVVAAPAPPPPAPAKAPAVAPTPPCLEISPAQGESFSLVNRRCRGHTVIAVIETREATGETACRGYEIAQSLAVRVGRSPPKLNYECVQGTGSCNKERLGDIFPECDW